MPEGRFPGTVAPSELRAVKVGETEVMLAGLPGGEVTALSSHCTHWGAPLSEGFVVGETVVCPWHRACFDLRSGACTGPPGMDALARYDVRREGDELVVTVPDEAPDRTPPSRKASGTGRTIVVVGLGGAGRSAADTLLSEGVEGCLVLVSAEAHGPHDRPMLSKSYLRGEDEDYLPLRDAAFYRARGADVRLGRRVTRLNAATKVLALDDGTALAYDVCILASGARPRPLDVPGANLRGVYTLRDTPDADEIRAAASRARHAVVVGSGFIGLEVAASLCQRGLGVTVVSRDALPLAHIVGERLARRILKGYEARGVHFVNEASVEAVLGVDRVERVRLTTGDEVEAGLVVAGLGVVPATDFVEGVERTPDGGIIVDAHLRAADGLFVAGDAAAFPLTGGRRVRIEHWRVASGHGRTAALGALGRNGVYRDVPYFWSNLLDFDFDLLGYPSREAEVHYDGDVDEGAFLAWFVREGRVEALLQSGRDDVAMATYALISAGHLPAYAEIAKGADLVERARGLSVGPPPAGMASVR
ncbi:MAG TPA: FAD-dependent oxidoreductase [Rhodothermales bacterium]|nr:FAD-dependent oxidoreductase [Rhodothermales bacterium]